MEISGRHLRVRTVRLLGVRKGGKVSLGHFGAEVMVSGSMLMMSGYLSEHLGTEKENSAWRGLKYRLPSATALEGILFT